METDSILNINRVQETRTVNDGITWKSCCFKSDKQFVEFLVSSSFIGAALFFCFYQLIHKESCSDQQSYLSVLGLILGCLLPQPHIHRDRGDDSI